MGLASLRPPLQLLLCGIITQRLLPYSAARLPLQLVLIPTLYFWSLLLVVWPYYLFVYQPYLSPLRHILQAPSELNNRKTWLAAEPSPPQLLQWVKAVKGHPNFTGLMRYRGIGGSERVLVCTPPALREVLVAQQYSSFDRPLMARKRIAVQAGNGLIASGGDVHKAQKRLLLPAFGPRAVRDLYPLFWRKAHELVSALSAHVKESESHGSRPIEITSWTSRSSLDIIGMAAWGSDFAAISHPFSDFVKSYSGMFDITGGGPFVNALALVVPMKYAMQIPFPYNKRLKQALQTVRERCKRVVRQRNSTSEEELKHDILSLLIREGIRDEDALVNQMMTMLAAGHDTSGLSLTWACYVLGRYPKVQTRLREEILASQLPVQPGRDDSTGDAQSIQGLSYLQAVVNEILRLYTPVPVTRREALQNTTVQGYSIPKDSHLVTSSWVVNRLDDQWAGAEEFRPDRWLEAQGDDVDTFAFASFSHGPRSCIGQGFARAELLVFLAALVGNFQIDLDNPNEEPEALYGITMSPANGLKIHLRKVE